MKDKQRKLIEYVRKHFAGIGVATVTMGMAITVAKGVSGQESGFDPGEIDTTFSTDFSGLPDITGYDLSGQGEDSEEVNHDSGHEQEEEETQEDEQEAEEKSEEMQDKTEEENANLALNEIENPMEQQKEQIILPEEMAAELDSSDKINASLEEEQEKSDEALTPDTQNLQKDSMAGNPSAKQEKVYGSGSGGGKGSGGKKEPVKTEENKKPEEESKPSAPEGNKPSGGETNKPPAEDKNPGEGGENRPPQENKDPEDNGGGTLPPDGGDQPENPGTELPPEENLPPQEPDSGKFSVVVDGVKQEFDNEDDALAWIADNNGTLSEETDKYFEGFIKDDDGNYIPSYADKDKFNGNGDVIYDYNGDSGVFVAPNGMKLDLGFASSEAREKIRTVVIPKMVETILLGDGGSFPVLEKFVVSADNAKYCSVDGVLYQKIDGGGTELMLMPAAKKEVLAWPDNLVSVGGNSFYASTLEKAELPGTVKYLRDNAFNESSVGTIILPEGLESVGSFAFSFAGPAEGEQAAFHRIIVKAAVPPKLSGTAFYWMDYALEHQQEEPVTEILVPDTEDDTAYEEYLRTWGMALAKRYGGTAALKILKTENRAQERFEYYEEDGKSGFRKIGQENGFYYEDASGVYRVNDEGKDILVRGKSGVSVADFSASGIVGIDEGAFDECLSLTVVKLPESLEAMPENIFSQNTSLRAVISYAENPPAEKLGAPENCAVFVKPEALKDYQDAWGGQVRRITGTSDTYTVLSSGIVFDLESTRLLDIPADMTSFQLPSYVKTIAEGAARGNTALNTVTVSSTAKLTTICAEAFSGCTNLSAITIPAAVTQVGEKAFSDCTNLRTVSWRSAASVPESCFEGCVKLTTFGASGSGHNLKAIGRRAFYGCQALQTVLYYSYSSGGTNYYYYYFLEEIGEEAFSGCSSMTYAYLHDSVKSVGDRAFAGSGLTQTFWYTDLSIPEYCFEQCRNLATWGWGSKSISAVGKGAFYGCTGLKSISLPIAVERIEQQAFDGREGSGLTLTFAADKPAVWDGPESLEDLLIYVPDSAGEDDRIYRAYLEEWESWLGEEPGNVLKTKDKAEERVPGEGKDEETEPEETEPEETEPEETEPEETEPEESSTEESSTEESSAEETSPEESSTEETSPEESSTEETSPEESSTEETSPEESSAEETSPEESSTEETSPEESSTEETSPEESSAEETSPEESSAEETSSGESAAGGTVSEEKNLGEIAAKPEKTESEESDLDEEKYGQVVPEIGKPEETDSEKSESEEPEPEESESEEPESKETESEEPEFKEPESKETKPEESESKEIESKEIEPKEPERKESPKQDGQEKVRNSDDH